MSAILTPVGLLLIILAGYLFKRFGLFGQKDYRVLQTAEFNIVLPGAIVYSFATNPHDISLLLISVFAFLFAFIPVVFIFLATRKRNVTDRAFLMLNGAGFNLGCFSFPVVQSFWGAGAVVPAVRHVSAHDRVDRRQREDSRLDRLYNPAIERRQRAGVDADGGHAHGPAPIQA